MGRGVGIWECGGTTKECQSGKCPGKGETCFTFNCFVDWDGYKLGVLAQVPEVHHLVTTRRDEAPAIWGQAQAGHCTVVTLHHHTHSLITVTSCAQKAESIT